MVIFPAWIQLVQTRDLWVVPLIFILILWRLGRKRRRVLPTILEPAPPLRLIIPRLLYLLPGIEPFPQILHTFMFCSLSRFESGSILENIGLSRGEMS